MWFSGSSFSAEIQTINLLVIKKKKKKERKGETELSKSAHQTEDITNAENLSPTKQWKISRPNRRLARTLPKERGNFLVSRRTSENELTSEGHQNKANIEKSVLLENNRTTSCFFFSSPPQSPTKEARIQLQLQSSKKLNIQRLSTSIGLNVHGGIFQRSKSAVMKVWMRDKEKMNFNFSDIKLNMVKRFNYTPANSLKMIVMGDSGVGKTALVSKLTQRNYDDTPTMGVQTTSLDVSADIDSSSHAPPYNNQNNNINGNSNKIVKENENQTTSTTTNVSFEHMKIPFHIWDLSGSDRYRSYISQWASDTAVCVIVYDITRQDSIANLKPWIKYIREFDRTNTIVSLIGTKLDLESKRKVPQNEAKIFAKTQAIDIFMEVSAMENLNLTSFLQATVKELFIRNVRKEVLENLSEEFSEEINLRVDLDKSTH